MHLHFRAFFPPTLTPPQPKAEPTRREPFRVHMKIEGYCDNVLKLNNNSFFHLS